MIRIALLVAFCGMACGGGKTTSKPRNPPKPDVIEPATPASADAGAEVTNASRTLTLDDCESLLGHMFGLIYQQKTENVPEAERPSPEDMQVAKDALRTELMKSCEGARPADFAFDCVMASKTYEALASCTGPPAS